VTDMQLLGVTIGRSRL